MSPEELQKLRILANSNDEFVNVVSSRLIQKAEQNNHKMMDFIVEEGLLISPQAKYSLLQASCVLCLYEINIQFGSNVNGDFADIEISGDNICVGKDI